MNMTLKDLWYNYISQECENLDSDTERKSSLLLADAEEKLRATLTDEQIKLLKKVTDSLDNLYSVFTEKAFIKGIQFASKYMLEALK